MKMRRVRSWYAYALSNQVKHSDKEHFNNVAYTRFTWFASGVRADDLNLWFFFFCFVIVTLQTLEMFFSFF